MIKIIAASDNHGNLSSIEEILNQNSNGDFYLHMGDCCCDPKEISPFISVKGNNDYLSDLPEYRIIDIDNNNRVYMVHGHQYVFNISKLVDEAKKNNCNIVLCGHTHLFTDYIKEGVRIINPGSCYYNRDRSNPCYALITIDSKGINVVKKEISSYF